MNGLLNWLARNWWKLLLGCLLVLALSLTAVFVMAVSGAALVLWAFRKLLFALFK